MDFGDVPAVLVWLIVAGLFLIAEVATGTLFLLWPAAAGLFFAAATYFFPQMSVGLQIAGFSVLAIALTAFGWGYLRIRPGVSPTDRPHLNRRAAQLVGRRVLAAEDFVNGLGPVTVGDTRWTARLRDQTRVIRAGAALEIIEVEGVQLIVKPI